MPLLNLFRSSGIAPVIDGLELQLMDVGARGGLDRDFIPAAWATNAIGFEPEPDECARLNARPAAPWRSVRFVPAALAGVNGRRSLHVPENGEGASLLAHNPAMLDAFGYEALHGRTREVSVDVLTLDTSRGRFRLPVPDYLKIDVEGAELEILRSAPDTLRECSAIKLETSFLEQRLSQPLMHDVVAFMLSAGFVLADIRGVHFWRRTPLPAHPFSARTAVPYSRGVPAQCDLVFLRDPATVSSAQSLVRLAVVSAILGFFDHAVGTIRSSNSVADELSRGIGADCVLELGKVSRRMGRAAAVSELQSQLRTMVPLIRSVLRGLPHRAPVNPAY